MKVNSLSFVLPMHNEEDNISQAIRKASKAAFDICEDYEIVVVDDASKDNSAGIVKDIAVKDPRVKFFELKKNTKFGGALNKGLMSATKDVIVYTDADFPVKEEDIKKAIDLLDGSDIVTAYSLVIKDASFKRILMSKGYNFLVRLLFGLKLLDINSGFKIYRKEVLSCLNLKSKSPFIDAEIFIEAKKRGFSITQYGLIFDLRTGGESSISRPGIVLRTFWDMVKYKLKIKN